MPDVPIATLTLNPTVDVNYTINNLVADHAGYLHPVQVADETRINCTLLQEDPPLQYEVDGSARW